MQSSFVGPTGSSIVRPDPVEGRLSTIAGKEDNTFATLWADPVLKKNLIASCCTWLFASFNFYMITFYLKYFPGNIFVNSLTFAASDSAAQFTSGIILQFVSVRTAYTIANSIGFTGGLLYLIFWKTEKVWLVPVIICIARVGAAMNFNIGYVSVGRLFPTQY